MAGETATLRPRAEIIDITDLHHPVLTDIQRGAVAAGEGVQVVFDRAHVLDAARAETGLDDFGADDFLERLDVWLQAIDEDENAAGLTRLSLHQMTVRFAATRLRIEDLVRRHPEILDIKIDRPIIVAGLPRSGTTHLLALLSTDTRLRSLPWWEAIAPVPTDADAPTPDDPNPRRTRADIGWKQYEATLPYIKAMHEFSADHISEDIELQALDFSSYLIEWMAHVPRWRDYYLSHDQTGPYAYLKKGLQVLTWLRGPNRWVIKCPQHMEQLPVLKKTFPDATFVITHRDPIGSIQSAMTMGLYASRVMRRRVIPNEQPDYWIDRYERLLRACVRDRDCLPPDQTIDLYFHQWIRDPDPVLAEIYRLAGLPVTETALAQRHAYEAAHAAEQTMKITYNLGRDFGLTAADIRKKFGFYFERFPVKVEVE